MAETRLDNVAMKASENGRGGWFATGGIVGAVLASSCCIVPLVLVTLGVSGAWIGSLTALKPYKPHFVTVTFAFLAGGFWHVYVRPKPDCVDGSYCARQKSPIITQAALWGAATLVALAVTLQWWAPLFY